MQSEALNQDAFNDEALDQDAIINPIAKAHAEKSAVSLIHFSRRMPNLAQQTPEQLRKLLRDYFIHTFDTYESLFETLNGDQAYYVKPINLRHPLIFYFGHTATFFVNKLLLTRMISQRINPRFESMFAVGVDEMSWDDLNDANYQWPTPKEVKHYRDQVRALVLDLIDRAPLQLPLDWNNPWWAIVMGIEHENIHLETSSVLIRQHQLHFVKNHPRWQTFSITANENNSAPHNQFVAVSEGHVILNKEKSNAFYGWDNEYGTHTANVNEFQASQYLVSNFEFLEFVKQGGYLNTDFWLDEGRGWLGFSRAQHPTFWIKKEGAWYLRLMTQEVPMQWNWPVEVNYHEAKAFCNWKRATTGLPVRLPTEDEWYRLYDVADLNSPVTQANLQLDYFASSCPIDTFKQGEFYDVIGNVWQWTETPIYPFEGFDVHPIYDDFTTPTFDERHNIMKGGSWISCGNETLRESRYAFRRHFFQHAGFRYVLSDDLTPTPNSHYESDKLLSEYAEFHYGDIYFNVPNFSKALVDFAKPFFAQINTKKALDLGCASGRATFELAQYFDHVMGLDFSVRFIGQGVKLSKGETLRYTLTDEGELVSYKSRKLSDLGLDATKDKVEFFQGDACNLKPQFTGYDFILAANLIDRLYKPAKFLNEIHERLNVGGILVLASPYTWLEDHTPREDWVGGFKKDGESFTTVDGLKNYLNQHFELLQAPVEVPFVIRETKRKFQHTLSEATVWKRIK